MSLSAPELGTIWAQTWLLLDDLIRPQQHRLRNRQPEGRRGLKGNSNLEIFCTGRSEGFARFRILPT